MWIMIFLNIPAPDHFRVWLPSDRHSSSLLFLDSLQLQICLFVLAPQQSAEKGKTESLENFPCKDAQSTHKCSSASVLFGLISFGPPFIMVISPFASVFNRN